MLYFLFLILQNIGSVIYDFMWRGFPPSDLGKIAVFSPIVHCWWENDISTRILRREEERIIHHNKQIPFNSLQKIPESSAIPLGALQVLPVLRVPQFENHWYRL